jgi:hypothetical protein
LLDQSSLVKAVFGSDSVLSRFEYPDLLHVELNRVVSLPVDSALELPYRIVKVITIED